jgi:hypothetical protein
MRYSRGCCLFAVVYAVFFLGIPLCIKGPQTICTNALKFFSTGEQNMVEVENEMNMLLRPCGMKAKTYVEWVIKQKGYTGLVTKEVFLPPNALDGAEYLRLFATKHRVLDKKDEEMKQQNMLAWSYFSIDVLEFNTKMPPLLLRYMNALAVLKHQRAEHIVYGRQCKWNT